MHVVICSSLLVARILLFVFLVIELKDISKRDGESCIVFTKKLRKYVLEGKLGLVMHTDNTFDWFNQNSE